MDYAIGLTGTGVRVVFAVVGALIGPRRGWPAMAGAGIGFFFGLIGLAVLGFVNGPDPAQPEFVYCRRLAAWKSAMDTQSRLPR